ncbi:MAG: hypothetical protein AAGD00_06595 [Planctomycetota bacterium]
MIGRNRSRTIVWLCPLLALTLSACSGSGGSTSGVGTAAISDDERSTRDRIAAVRTVWDDAEAEARPTGAVRESLKRIIWKRGEAPLLRLAAYDALLLDEANIADTRNMSRLLLPTETEWEMIERIARESIDRGWQDLAPAFVRSWSREVDEPPDSERPERDAIAQLFPDRAVEDSVFAVFLGDVPGPALRERDRADAWTLLARIDPDGARTTQLVRGSSARPNNPEAAEILDDLRAAASTFGTVPRSTPQLQAIRRLRASSNRAWWSEASSVYASRGFAQPDGISLRHAPAVMHASRHRPGLLDANDAELIRIIDAHQRSAQMHGRDTSDSGVGVRDELVARQREPLGRGDLLVCAVLIDAVTDPAFVAEMFRLADIDHEDRSTEHGGILVGETSGAISPRHHPPRANQRFRDDRFVASTQMLEAGDTAIAHFHLQVQDHKNRTFAGPSAGDIEYARTHDRVCAVATFIDKNTLNFDVYGPDGWAIDLGELKRPDADQP